MLGVITSGYFILTYFILERKECFRKRKKRINLLKLKSTIKFLILYNKIKSKKNLSDSEYSSDSDILTSDEQI